MDIYIYTCLLDIFILDIYLDIFIKIIDIYTYTKICHGQEKGRKGRGKEVQSDGCKVAQPKRVGT